MKKLAGLICMNYNLGDFGLLTDNRPVASLPYGGRYRLMDFPLSNLINTGMTTVGIITPHLYRSILDHVGNGKSWNLSRKSGGLFILPGSTYGFDAGRGKITVKDIIGNKRFLERADSDYIVIACCDKVFNIDYKEVVKSHIESSASVTLCYKYIEKDIPKNEYAISISNNNLVSDIKKLKRVSKNENVYIDTLVINTDLLLKITEWYKDQSYQDLLDVIEENINHIVVNGYEFKGYVKIINNVKDYMDAGKELLNEEVIEDLFNNRMIYTKIHDAPPVKYDKKAKVENSIIATGSIIKGKVKNSIIFRDCVVEEGAEIINSIVMQKSVVNKNVHLENVILDKYAKIADGVEIKGTEEKPIIITRNQYS